MRFLNDLNLFQKLLLMAAVPIAGLILLSTGATVDRYWAHRNTVQLEQLARLAGRAGALVHALQRERGLSATFLASGGATLRPELEEQRGETDERLDRLHAVAAAGVGPELEARLDKAAGALEGLKRIRREVDAQALGSGEVIAYYSRINGHLLDAVAVLPRYTAEAAIANRLAAHLQLLELEEAAGQERAVAGSVFAAGQATPAQHQRLAQLDAQQRLRLEGFRRLAGPELREALAAVTAATESGAVERMRRLAREEGRGVSPEAWFTAATDRIDRFITLDKEILDQVQAVAQRLRGEALSGLLWVVALVGAGIALTLYLVYAVTHAINSQVGHLTTAMRAFSNGSLDCRVATVGNDEFGQIAGTFNDMVDTLEETTVRERAHHKEEQQKAERFKATVDEIGETLRLVAFGDLTRTVAVPRDDPALAQLAYNINMMINGLRELTREMIGATGEMAQSMGQLQEATQSQSAAAAEQASSSNQTMTTLEEIRVIADQSRDKAQSLGQTADRALREGEEGRQQVSGSLRSMGDIRTQVETIGKNIRELEDQTRRIEQVNAAVGGLAQQSKMLALNASIEAAKAGKAGKGFAAVAREVRNLAQQSAESSGQVQAILKEVRQAMQGVVRVVEQGTGGIVDALHAVEQTGTTLERLSNVIEETAIASKQIVAAVQQESTGIDQLATAVQEINKATNQFADTTRQTESASRNLERITRALQEHAEVYEV